MAFSLFSKPTTSKAKVAPPLGKAAAADMARSGGPRKPDAGTPGKTAVGHSVADHAFSIAQTGGFEWRPAPGAIEVAESRTELCMALENAALFHANGQFDAARQTLTDAVLHDLDARRSLLAWLALFDVLQRCGDRVTFDEMSLRFVHAFERSPPIWEEHRALASQSPSKRTASASYIRFAGSLAAEGLAQIEVLRKLTASGGRCRVDFTGLTEVDESVCLALAEALRTQRRKAFPLQVQGAAVLRKMLEQSIRIGEPVFENYWLLLLELLQWTDEHAEFEDCAVKYAVSFEVSPPSWEPAPLSSPCAAQQAAVCVQASETDIFFCQGAMIGPAEPQISAVLEYAHRNKAVTIDFTAVERIDFVCAGALLNVLELAERGNKPIQLIGASPIVQALLLVIGVRQSLFPPKSR